MKLSFGLPTHRVDALDELSGADAIAELSVAAEDAGFDAVFVTDHPFPADPWLSTGGHQTLDPFVALELRGRGDGADPAADEPADPLVPQPVPLREGDRVTRRAVGRPGHRRRGRGLSRR